MDPFVQHTIADISGRFFGYLVFILAYSTVIHGAVRTAFRLLGVDFAHTWWDEACIVTLGIFFAVGMDLNAMFYIAAVTPENFISAHTGWQRAGVPGGQLPIGLVFLAGNLVTGMLVAGGRRAVVGIAEEFQAGLEKIKAIMDRKAISKE